MLTQGKPQNIKTGCSGCHRVGNTKRITDKTGIKIKSGFNEGETVFKSIIAREGKELLQVGEGNYSNRKTLTTRCTSDTQDLDEREE